MTEHFDAIVIGSGLGGLTAGALFSHAGYRYCCWSATTTSVVPPPPIAAGE